MFGRTRIALAAVVAALLSLAGVAVGQDPQDPDKGGRGIPQSPSCGFPGEGAPECVTGGKVTVTFSKRYWSALRAKNVRIEVGAPATRRGRAITFPVSARGDATTYRDSYVRQDRFLQEDGSCAGYQIFELFVYFKGRLTLTRSPRSRYPLPVRINGGFVGAGINQPVDDFSVLWRRFDGRGSTIDFLARGVKLPARGGTAPLGGNRVRFQVGLRRPSWTFIGFLADFKPPRRVGRAAFDLRIEPRETCE